MQTHPDCKDGNLIANAALKQGEAIDALSLVSELVKKSEGTMMLFDNTPDYLTDPSSTVLARAN